jgi:hypothetical protein
MEKRNRKKYGNNPRVFLTISEIKWILNITSILRKKRRISRVKMVAFSKSIIETIQRRFSCRIYFERPIDEEIQKRLENFMSSVQAGPLGTKVRFKLVAALEQERNSLRGLGTYGFIRGARGFVIGAAHQSEKDLEDYGFLMERLILFATDLGLGTCWLGGSFTRSSFARRISLKDGERMPAVTSIGYMANPEHARKAFLRRRIDADRRLPWDRLFFNRQIGLPLKRQEAGDYVKPLDMVRLGPSASNKQPWRIVKNGNAWHFYLQRTKGYRERLLIRFLQIDDLQRVDMGIAMCHFELTAHELDLGGYWVVQEPAIEKPDELTEYTVSWVI